MNLFINYSKYMFKFSHHGHNLNLMVPFTTSKYGNRSFSVIGPKIFNNLPLHDSTSISIESFKCSVKTYLFKNFLMQIEVLSLLVPLTE